LLAQARAGLRIVSPAGQALTAPQLGQSVELGAAAALGSLRGLALVTLQAWRTLRPHPLATPVAVSDVQTVMDTEPTVPIATDMAEAVENSHTSLECIPTIGAVVADTPALVLAAASLNVAVAKTLPRDENLLERGIAAMENGAETVGYACFKRATEVDPTAARAWFLRARTAETLDEVIDCLTHANALEPSNSLIATNLDWAIERRESRRQAAKSKPKKAPDATATATPTQRGPGVAARAAGLALELARMASALAAFGLAAAWLLSAVPAQTREAVIAAVGFAPPRLPDANRLAALVHIPLGGGYDLGSALPYGIGFLAVFVGLGLLSRERWTHLWAPALAVAGAWLFVG
jgi:hypothetical protein